MRGNGAHVRRQWRHRAPRFSHPFKTLVNLDTRRKMFATALAAGLGFAFLAAQGGSATAAGGNNNQAASAPIALVASAEQARAQANLATNRSLPAREFIAPVVAKAEAATSAVQTVTKAAVQKAPQAPAKPVEVAPVAGLTQTQ